MFHGRSLALGLFVVGLLSVPGALALAQSSGEEAPGVPASECPEAVAAEMAMGLDPAERYVPECPSSEQLARETEEMAEGPTVAEIEPYCRWYDDENLGRPDWCPPGGGQ